MFVDFTKELLEAKDTEEFYSKLFSVLSSSIGSNVIILSSNSRFIRWSKLKSENEELLVRVSRYLIKLNLNIKQSQLFSTKEFDNPKFVDAINSFDSSEAIVSSIGESSSDNAKLIFLGNDLSKIDLNYLDSLLKIAGIILSRLNFTANFVDSSIHDSTDSLASSPLGVSAAESLAHKIIKFDKLGRVNYVSNEYLSFFGLKRKKVMQMHFSDLIQKIVVEADREIASNYYWNIYEKRNKKIECKSFRVKNKKGEEVLIADNFHFDGTQFHSLILPFSGVEKQQNDNTSERYRRLVENSDAIIFHVDAGHRISFISQRALDFFGVAAEDFLSGQKVEWFDLIHIDDRERVRKNAINVAKKVDSLDEELRVVNHLTGRMRWLLVKLVPVQEKNGAIGGWDAFGVDITVRKEALRELDAKRIAYKNQARKLSALYKVSHELSGFLSADEIFSKSFDIIKQELGFKRLWVGLLDDTGTKIVGQAAYGPNWKKHLVEIDLQLNDPSHPICKVVNSRSPLVLNSSSDLIGDENIRKFFSKFEIESVGLIPLIAGGQVLGVLAFQPENENSEIDKDVITLISSLSAEIAANLLTKRLEERAGETDKMKAAGLLAAGVAHNFNNLLQAILGQSSLLKMLDVKGTESANDEIKQAASVINDAASKGAALVRQLMSFSNVENPRLNSLDINLLLERGEVGLKRNLKSKQKLILDLSDKLPKVLIDSRQVLRIISTLLLNAKEAMNEEGRVKISTQYFKISETSAHFEVPIGNYIRIVVEDNGRGMDLETKKRCFEPFYSTKNLDSSSGIAFSGAGLGLAAAYALAQKNNGILTVDSSLGKGTKFSLYLPEFKHSTGTKKANE